VAVTIVGLLVATVMARELEPWGGEVGLPGWLKRLLRRPEPPQDTEEGRHERLKGRGSSDVSVFENANRASMGASVDLYNEGRANRRP
jgi:hypothetical protein